MRRATLAGPSGLGIDVAAERLHCVELDGVGAIKRAAVLDPRSDRDRSALLGWAREVGAVAIDAPASPSSAPHQMDPDALLSAKFRPARCAEIALGRRCHIWVPWVTPRLGAKTQPWIKVGHGLFADLRASAGRRVSVVETFPHAVFRVLAGSGPLPSKQTAVGIEARVTLLEQAGVSLPQHPTMWSHDALDAVAAALIARGRARDDGSAVGITCDASETTVMHDGSEIWIPASATAPVIDRGAA